MGKFIGREAELKAIFRAMSAETAEAGVAYNNLQQTTLAAGAMDKKSKALIALGIGICMRCDGCVAGFVHDALEAGATRAEILETIQISILMGGNSVLASACDAFESLNQHQGS